MSQALEAVSNSRHAPYALGWASLTATERAVTDLVARALTNRQVGERLLISRHTVDSHLRQIYRKLGIASRVELTRLVVADENMARPKAS
jgi:DNA-binding CsgD family transcriptional regulator